MKRLWSRWLELWLVEEEGTSQALFRIATGASVLFALLSVVGHHDLVPLWFDAADGGYSRMNGPPWLVMLVGGPHPLQVTMLLGGALLCGALLMLGLGGRWPALIGLWLYDNVTGLRGDAAGSYDPLITNALFLVFLSDSTATLSLACRQRTGVWMSTQRIRAWPRYLAIFQMVLMYFTTALQKVSDTWIPGGDHSALYYILQQPTWHRMDMSWVAHVFLITQLLSAMVWSFEMGSPLLLIALYFRRTAAQPGRVRALFNRLPIRQVFILVGLGMHVGIFASMQVDPFCCMAMSFYLNLVRPEEWPWRKAAVATVAARPAPI